MEKRNMYFPKGGTGFGVQLIVDWLQQQQQHKQADNAQERATDDKYGVDSWYNRLDVFVCLYLHTASVISSLSSSAVLKHVIHAVILY